MTENTYFASGGNPDICANIRQPITMPTWLLPIPEWQVNIKAGLELPLHKKNSGTS